MFDLEQAIAHWRKQMIAAGMESRVLLDELEGHLRDDIARRLQSGVDAQRAFEVSAQQIGKAHALDIEFEKIGTSALVGKLMVVVGALFVGFILFLGTAAVVLCYATWAERVTASTAMLCGLIVACRWRHMLPLLPVIADPRKRLAAGLVCFASAFGAPAFILNVVLPHNREPGLPAIGLWSFFLLTVLLCAGVGIFLSDSESGISGMGKSNFDESTSSNS